MHTTQQTASPQPAPRAETPLRPVDHSALGTNQAAIIILLIAAFIFNQPWLAAGVAVMMLGGSALGQPAFGWLYRRVLKPLGIVRPDLLLDNPQPHRFAQSMGGVFVLLAFLALLAGWGVLGWALAWLVVALAALNLLGGFCVGCAIYYWLARLRAPGFDRSPPAGVFPGRRPRARVGEGQ